MASKFFSITISITPSNFISTSTSTTSIHNEILPQCDRLNAIIDGIIEDPDSCKFRLETLTCENKTATNRLNPTQVEIVQKKSSPPSTTKDKNLVYPAAQSGSEIIAAQKTLRCENHPATAKLITTNI